MEDLATHFLGGAGRPSSLENMHIDEHSNSAAFDEDRSYVRSQNERIMPQSKGNTRRNSMPRGRGRSRSDYSCDDNDNNDDDEVDEDDDDYIVGRRAGGGSTSSHSPATTTTTWWSPWQ